MSPRHLSASLSPPPPLSAGKERVRVMQLTDWLAPGGKERVAVNVGNLLPRDRYESFFCTTRSGGSLERFVARDVARLRLTRRRVFDVPAIRELVAFNAAHRMDVLHAHGSSLFIATLASMFAPYPAVVWHDHYGPCRGDDRSVLLYRCAAARVAGVIAVNRSLAEWARRKLHVRSDRVWYIPNFACEPPAVVPNPVLPGQPGARVVCVAHLRPQKDHLTLIRAFARVAPQVPAAHLFFVGSETDREYVAAIRRQISEARLERHVSLLGERDDVTGILAQCDVGVLSSRSEGFPLALVEYGQAGLATVATRVGQCPEVLDDGRAGALVDVGDAARLGDALTGLLRDTRRRRALGAALRARVHARYRSGPIVEDICRVYEAVRGSHRVSKTGEGS